MVVSKKSFSCDIFMACNPSLAAILSQALFQSFVHIGLILSSFLISSYNDNCMM